MRRELGYRLSNIVSVREPIRFQCLDFGKLKFFRKRYDNKDGEIFVALCFQDKRWKEQAHMSSISAIASAAVAVNQSKLQENVAVNLLRMNAQAEQAVAAMVTQNAQQIEMLSGNSSGGRINLFV